MGKLGINLGFLISQVVNFSLLMVLLYMFLYKPILRMFDERKARIQKGMEDAQATERKAAQAEEEFERRVAGATKEGEKVIAQVTAEGGKMREEILAQAREEARQLIEEAQEEIAQERQQAMDELREQVMDLSILITKKVIGEALDESTHRRLISEFLAEAGDLQ